MNCYTTKYSHAVVPAAGAGLQMESASRCKRSETGIELEMTFRDARIKIVLFLPKDQSYCM